VQGNPQVPHFGEHIHTIESSNKILGQSLNSNCLASWLGKFIEARMSSIVVSIIDVELEHQSYLLVCFVVRVKQPGPRIRKCTHKIFGFSSLRPQLVKPFSGYGFQLADRRLTDRNGFFEANTMKKLLTLLGTDITQANNN